MTELCRLCYAETVSHLGVRVCARCSDTLERGLAPHTTYLLVDPRDNLVRYVGCTSDVGGRYSIHCSCTHNKQYANDGLISWIWQIRDAGLRPSIEVVGRFYYEAGLSQPAGRAYAAEKALIIQMLNEGHPILNRKLPSNHNMLEEVRAADERLGFDVEED